jgi:hypothetical protein
VTFRAVCAIAASVLPADHGHFFAIKQTGIQAVPRDRAQELIKESNPATPRTLG